MGTTDRWREWERKLAAPELVGFRSLSAKEPEQGPDPGPEPPLPLPIGDGAG
jgi:hypothetical protein